MIQMTENSNSISGMFKSAFDYLDSSLKTRNNLVSANIIQVKPLDIDKNDDKLREQLQNLKKELRTLETNLEIHSFLEESITPSK